MTRVMKSKNGAKVSIARDHMDDSEGIVGTIKKELDGSFGLYVREEQARIARLSLKYLREDMAGLF